MGILAKGEISLLDAYCTYLILFFGTPRYVLLRYPKFVTRSRLSNFDRCHSFLLASSATGSARKRPHFDSLHNYDATACIIIMEPHSMRLNELCSLNPLRIRVANLRRRRNISFHRCKLYIFVFCFVPLDTRNAYYITSKSKMQDLF